MQEVLIVIFLVACIYYWLYVLKHNNEWRHIVFGFKAEKIREWHNGSHWLVEYNYEGNRGIMLKGSFLQCFKRA